jgi:hypothetical protein
MRNIIEVIESIKKWVPKDNINFISDLDWVINDASFRAPECIGVSWASLQEIIFRHIKKPEGAWQINVVALFADKTPQYIMQDQLRRDPNEPITPSIDIGDDFRDAQLVLIEDWDIDECSGYPCLCGRVFNHQRFSDGKFICTSTIYEMNLAGQSINTRNTTYVLGKPFFPWYEANREKLIKQGWKE